MTTIFQLGTSLVSLAVFCGGVVVVLFIVYAGFLYATSGGEPQRVAQARSALFMSLLGLLIMGLAFVIPRILSDVVIRPSGGEDIARLDGVDCDSVLQNQLVHRREVRNREGMQQVVVQIRNKYTECSVEIWAAEIGNASGAMTAVEWSRVSTASAMVPHLGTSDGDCGTHLPGYLSIPFGLRADQNKEKSANDKVVDSQGRSSLVSMASMRDSRGNIVVWFNSEEGNVPWDGSLCWIYHERHSLWVGAEP